MRIISLLWISLLFSALASAQHKKAYQIFNSKGKKVTYAKMLKETKTADVVLFGELHNNAISHWMQFELTTDLLKEHQLILGAEMFEADNQDAINKYLSKELDVKTLGQEARLWPNFKTDYKPLLDIAKDNNLPFIATNVPRRFASMVYKNGVESLDTLSSEDKKWMAPLPFAYDAELSCYKKMLSMGGGHGGENLPKAQALKDATMAYFIVSAYQSEHLFVHYNGAYHSNFHEGIVWHINKYNKTINVVTISTASQSQLKHLDEENKGKADFIICVDENMTSTY